MMIHHQGAGVVNSAINKLPFELHIPGYQYCGPGTKLKERINRGDSGINGLDKACREHDIAYSKNRDLSDRHKADKILEEAAWSRVKSKDATIGEKIAAWGVTTTMKAKRKLGMGISMQTKTKNKKIGKIALRKGIINKARNAIKKIKNLNLEEATNIALVAAKGALKAAGGRTNIKTPRIIPVPKSGGLLPLIPLFAGLSALGALAGGASGIATAVNKAKSAQKQLEEAQRHNQTMEAIAMKGSGLYLKPYKKGLGLYLKPQKKN